MTNDIVQALLVNWSHLLLLLAFDDLLRSYKS